MGQTPTASELDRAHTAPQFGAHTSLSEKLLAVAIRAQNFTGSTGTAIALTEGGDDMVCRANWGTSAPEVGAKLSIEHSFTGLCVRTGEPVRCDDAQKDPRVNAEACRALGISAIAAVPVRRGLKVIGVLAAFSDTANAFSEKHLLILGTLSEVIVELLDDPHPVRPLPEAAKAAPSPAEPAVVTSAPIVVPSALQPQRVNFEQAELPKPSAVLAAPPVKVGEPASAKPVMTPPPRPAEPQDAPAVAAPPAAPVAPPLPMVTPATLSAAGSNAGKAKISAVERSSTAGAQKKRQTFKDEVLPAAMDPGMAKFAARTLQTTAPAGEKVREHDETLAFQALEAQSRGGHRWLWAIGVFAAFVMLVAAGWKLHVSRTPQAVEPAAPSTTAGAAPAPVAESTSSAAAPSEQVVEVRPPAPEVSKQSPFSPPPMANVVTTRLGSAAPAPRPSEAPARNPEMRKEPQAVVEATGPVRVPKAAARSQASEPAAPQLALATPAAFPTLANPAPAAVAAPTSRLLPAQLMHRVSPAYPELARRMQASGNVVLSATITKEGKVGDVRWVKGNALFRDSSISAVKQWHYKPATLNGEAVDSDLEIVLQFKPPAR